jgi:hypothetical protein
MTWLTALRWIASASLGILGAWVVTLNYACIAIGIARRGYHSMIPLLGGCALAVALLACPASRAARWAWVPLAADPGCLFAVLLLGYSAIITRGFRR